MTHATANFQAMQTTHGDSKKGFVEAYETDGPGPEAPPMETAIGYKLRRAQLHVFQDFHETFSEFKLRPTEFAVLSLIASTPGLKQTEVAEQLGIKRANFVALMDALERRNLAERRKGDLDRRSHSLHLTPEGMEFVARMSKLWHEHESRIIERLGGKEQRDALIELLNLLVETEHDDDLQQASDEGSHASLQRPFEQIRRA